MDKMSQPNNVLKLNDTDRKVLLAYANALMEEESKPKLESTSEKEIFVLP